jgi:hypothetical protein
MRFPDFARSIGRARTEAPGFVFCDPGSTNTRSGDASFTLRADAGLLVPVGGHGAGLGLPHPAAERGHLRSVLAEFVSYYNQDRPHRSLGLETPVPSPRQPDGEAVSRPVLNGLHHVYERAA